MPLIERNPELGVLAELLAAARDRRGSILLVEGPPGIGKTALLATARMLAETHGFRSLSAVGGELDQELPFAIVRQLLERPLLSLSPAARADLLAGAAGLAAPVFGLDDQVAMPDPSATSNVVYGLYWVCSNLADSMPLLLTVDDVHWADEASLRFLSHLARRITDLPVLLVVAGRPGTMLDDFAGRALSGVRARNLRLRPLSDNGVALLVRWELSVDAEDEFCRACARASGGNPFLLTEALRSLQSDGVRPVAGEAGRVERVRPETIARAVLSRIGRLGPEATRFTRALAVLGSGAELRQVARQANLAAGVAAELADALARQAIITPSRPVEFTHPLIRAAVYADSSEVLRAADHKRAARRLAEDGAAAEQLVPHLLASEPDSDPWVIDTLREAAVSALARGAPEPAAACLRRALAEPPALAGQGLLHADLGRALGMANRPDEAASALHRAIELAGNPLQRAQIALELFYLMVQADRIREAVQAVDLARRSVDRNAPDLPLPLHAAFALADMTMIEPPASWIARLDRLVPQLSADHDTDRMLLSILAFGASVTGDRPASEVARLAGLAAPDPLPARDTWMLVNMASAALAISGRVPEAIDLVDRGIDAVRRRGAAVEFRYLTVLRSHTALEGGHLEDAEGDGRAALEMQGETRPRDTSLAAAVLVDALVERGSLDEAQRVLADNGLERDQPFDTLIAHFVLMARGRLRVRQNRVRQALTDFHACGKTLADGGYTNPGFAQWRAEAAVAHLAIGETDAATGLAAENLALARAFGAPRALGLALRASGLIKGGPQGLTMLEEAAATLAGSSADLEYAYALVDYGAALRRAGQRKQACDALRRGLDLAARCRAENLADRAANELRAAGARPRRQRLTGRDALTASELRIAILAAKGLTNLEIAQASFLVKRTVETHLTSTYRKLGINTRDRLAEALDGPPSEAAPGQVGETGV
jgi:DNA-binding CsgD family transcriptional regulator